MFQFRRFPACTYVFSTRWQSIALPGFPIRKSMDITPICGSPWLIAACRVLHRLSVPRHSPCALYSLTCSSQSPLRSVSKQAWKLRALPCSSPQIPTRLRWARNLYRCCFIARIRISLGWSMFLTYPLAICSMIFRSYPNNILEKPYIKLLYLSIKRNNI